MGGPTLSMDASGCARSRLEDLDLMTQLLTELASGLGMTLRHPPFVERYAGTAPDEWGISGLLISEEGKLSLHTFPEQGLVSLDIVTRSLPDLAQTERLLIERLGAKQVDHNQPGAPPDKGQLAR